ncbi:MAG: CPBP family intramembrane glutamic endopeptidase [Gammaproteobacteria bacterium]
MSYASLNSTKFLRRGYYPFIIFTTCSVVLLLQHFLSASGVAGNFISGLPYFINLNTSFAYVLGWGIFTIFIYACIPLVIIYALKETPKQYGFSFNKNGKLIFLIAPLLILPITFIFSKSQDFQNTYPYLINPNSLSEFICWELIYLAQFAALEFFFRGFMLHAFLRLTNVLAAMLLTSIPYMLIHLVKPTPETISSFFGSMFLCWIAIKFRSIAIGIYLHILLAASMDFFVLFNKGWFNEIFI